MSLEYKYAMRDFSDKEALRAFIDDEMNRPDSLDELLSVILQADGTYLAVLRSKKQARQGERFERNLTHQREHERFQGGSNFAEQNQGGQRRHFRQNGQRDFGRQDNRGQRFGGRQDNANRGRAPERLQGLPVEKDEPTNEG